MNNDNIETLIMDKELDERFQNERKKIYRNTNKKIKRKKKIKLFFYRIIFFIALIAFIFSAYKIGIWLVENYENNKKANEVIKIASIKEKTTDDNIPLVEVDFKDLIKRNSDTVAWIKVNGTNVNYPVVQAKDNDYYLTHDYDKSFNSAGWIFSDYRNNFNELNYNTVLYGHGRLDGSMFGSLKDMFDENFFNKDENKIINITTPEYSSSWEIFSIYSIKSESYYITTDFTNDNSFSEFIDTIKKRSVRNFNVEVDQNDKILTLSTCKNDYGDRIAVHAKLIKKEIKD